MSDSEASYEGWEEDPSSSICLFCPTTCNTAELAFKHMVDQHSFDFVAVKKQLALDTYGGIRMINYLRAATKKGLASADSTDQLLKTASEWTRLDEYLKPFMMDDALIFGMHESDGLFSDDENEEKNSDKVTKAQLEAKILSLQDTVATLAQQLRIAHPELAALTGEESKEKELSKKETALKELQSEDTDYFGGYSARNIHEEMLRDKPRTEAYQQFAEQNKTLFEDKTVLDIGCGTGILCLFAAKAGAKQVVGIDRADIIDKARQVVKDNGYDGVISLVKAKVEEAELPVEKVDLIVSEWMGYFLLFESMLPSVLYARDKWLKPGGGVYPSRATMMVAGVEDGAGRQNKLGFWKNVYGFDMSCMESDEDKIRGCSVETLGKNQLVTSTCTFLDLDMLTVTNEDLDFDVPFEITASQDTTLGALATWFDTSFEHNCSVPVMLSTSPEKPYTHWQQTVFYLFETIKMIKGDKVTGKIHGYRMVKQGMARSYQVSISYKLGEDGTLFQQDFVV